MDTQIQCCIRNLQQFQYGEVLDELAGRHDVSLERCQNHCVGCRIQPAFVINGHWVSIDDPWRIKQYIEGSDS
jgi:hypothetical protein